MLPKTAPEMHASPEQVYLDLMSVVRDRLDVIAKLAAEHGGDFARAETAAFHGRKIIEGIAFGCLVATERGLKHIPRDAKGQWNAESILKSLEAKGLKTFPSPSLVRAPTADETASHQVKLVVEGVPEKRIANHELIAMYQRLHRWLHELNPYVTGNRTNFSCVHGKQLWDDLSKLEAFIERHVISIGGQGFMCVLRDTIDNTTKVVPISKVA